MKHESAHVLELTRRNREIANKFVNSVSDLVSGILLTGSNAWGAGYAVNEKSDIDLLVVYDDTQALDQIISCYISEGLLNVSERERFQEFKNLFERGEAEQFSVIASQSGVPVSIDFLDTETLRKIASLSLMGSQDLREIKVRFIKEFRTNPPKPLGYSLDDLCSPKKITYHPAFKEIKDEEGIIRGYLAETAVDGFGEEQTYFLGVMSFYLSVAPVILFDKEGELARATSVLQSKIREILRGRPLTNITRQERMSKGTLRQIQSDL